MDLPTHYVFAFGAGTAIVMLMLWQLGARLLGHAPRAELEDGNTARALVQVGGLLSVLLLSASTVQNCLTGEGLVRDLTWVAAFGATSLVLMMGTAHLGIRALLRSNLPKLVEEGNVAAGFAAASHYVATGLLTAKAFAGNDVGSLSLSLAFFVLAQTALVVLVVLFRALTSYDDAKEIATENLAAALPYGGLNVAIALLVGKAVEGKFEGWGPSLRAFGLTLLANLAFYPVRQIVVQGLILKAAPSLRGGRLDQAIADERNVGLGALEGATYVATALVVLRLWG